MINKDKIDWYNERQIYLKNKKISKNLTILSNTCIGGKLYNDYHEKLLSPTVDLYILPHDFVKFCNNLEHYLDLELIEDFNEHIPSNFISTKLGDINIYFSHSNYDFQYSKLKWNERKKRINFNNIVVICTDRNTICCNLHKCDKNVIEQFKKIPYKKIMFCIDDYNDESIAYLKSFKDEICCPEATRPSIKKDSKYILEEDGFDLDSFIS